MRTLHITTYWTVEEADTVYQLLDNFKDAIWQSYGEELVQMHKAIYDEQQARNEETFFVDDEVPF